MLAIVAKLCAAAVLAAVGLQFWKTATRWSEQGEVPEEWIESVKPSPLRRDEPSFGPMIVWQKAMAVMIFFFAGLCVLSVPLQLLGMV
ncbi:MAG: hypothetical protein V4537_03670 [Pseudomonadota bacterium]